MGVKELNHDKLLEVAQGATEEGETIHNMPFPVTAESVYAALLTAHELGQL
jgi:glycerol dehydrogenase